MAVFKCKMCGGSLEILNESVTECLYCGTKQTLPKLGNERKENLYDRAGHFRYNNEYDKAMQLYEQILNEDPTDAESYWSLVLCRFGIEYVQDPASGRRVPTINRAQRTSIFDDDNYKSALRYADPVQRVVYEQEAKTINEIQKGILQISENEDPFDVFICYKETDRNGRRTPDSVLANDLYHQLTQEGFKVFFARITLEDKLGSAYEPYIFAALNSAKVMVVLGTNPEYIQATWVKNEWSRFLAMIKAGEKKSLIPAYKDMDPYDLPEEFSHLQAQDMSKLGFMQDLIRGIKKLVQTDVSQISINGAIPSTAASLVPLIKRMEISLEDGEWDEVLKYCERILDIDPECTQAYFGKLMVAYECNERSDLLQLNADISSDLNVKRIRRFGTKEEIEFIDRCIENFSRSGEDISCPCCGEVFFVTEELLKKGYGHCPFCNENLQFDSGSEENIVICPVCGDTIVLPVDMNERQSFFCLNCKTKLEMDTEEDEEDKETIEDDQEYLIKCATCRRHFKINDSIAAQGVTICPYCSTRLNFEPYGPMNTIHKPAVMKDRELIGEAIDWSV